MVNSRALFRYMLLLSVGYFAATNMPIAINRIGVCCEVVLAGVCGVPCWSALLFGRLALRLHVVGNTVNQFVRRIHRTLFHL